MLQPPSNSAQLHELRVDDSSVGAERVVFLRLVVMNPLETQPYTYLLRG